MNTRAFARGDFARGNWMVSARRGYLDLVLDLMGEDEAPKPTYYDALAKVGYRLDERHTLFAHFLGAQDQMDFVEDDRDISNTKYQNTYTWLTLSSTFGPHLLAQTLLARGQGDHQREGLAFEGGNDRVDFRVSDERDAGFWGFKQDWRWEAGEDLFLKWGTDLRRVSAQYDYLSQKEQDQVLGDSLRHWTDTTQVRLEPAGNRGAGYLAARISLAAPLKAEAGLRYDRASYAGAGRFSPRLNLLYTLGKQTSLRAGWGRFCQSQGLSGLRVEEGERAFFPSEESTHWVVGLEHHFAGGPQLRAEAYYEKAAHLPPVYRNWHDAIEIFPELQDDRVALDLSGATAKGLEVYLKQEVGREFTWWASYGLAWSREQIETGQLALDQELPGRYDQRRTFYLDANYRPRPKWHLNLAWQYRSGWPYTERFLRVGTLPDGQRYVYEETGAPYGRNYPAFHRLDLRLSRFFDTPRGRISAFLEAINLYNHGNVRAYEYGLLRLPNGDLRQTKSPEYWFRLLPSMVLAGCIDEGSPLGSALPENLKPLTGTEPRYLAFQIFEGGPDPTIPFDQVMVYTPKAKIAAIAHDLVTTIGVTGGARAKLAFVLGPISFDHTDAEAQQIIDDGFAIALAENIAVGFHLDDAMFWSNRTDLIGDPANVEWTDFSGKLSTGLLLDWAQPPARMCFNAPKIQAEVTRRAREVIGAEIVSQLAILKAQGKEHLFAGVIAGWESHMGQDVVTMERVGFHALANRGFGPGHPPSNVSAEVASIVAEFVGLWTSGLAQAGIDPTRIYTHVAFLTKAQFATLTVPPNATYEILVDMMRSSQRPSVAFAANARPGFSTYPVAGLFDQILEERSLHGVPEWASSEGTNLLPPAGDSGMTMETYLARSFNHGATLVNVYSWGIGGPSFKETNPFRITTEGPEALATYRKFLSQ